MPKGSFVPSTLVNIIIRDRGTEAYSDYAGFQITDPEVIVSAARQTLESIPPSFGSCVMVSAGFTAYSQISRDTRSCRLGRPAD
jgi:hypothetical protein